MTADAFRRIALGLTSAAEGSHMGHPDFRVGSKIFATLHADMQWGMVKLRPEQQQQFIERAPGMFVPEKGAWGLKGYTAVRLAGADEETVGEALTVAFQNVRRAPARARKTRNARRP